MSTPEQDQASTQMDRLAIIGVAVVCIVALTVLTVMNKETAEFIKLIIILIPMIAGIMVVHTKVVNVEKQTNGQLTARLDSQTADMLNAVAALVETPPRRAAPDDAILPTEITLTGTLAER